MRVFMNEAGRLYKAEKPNSSNDCEKIGINPDLLDVLTATPQTQEDVEEVLVQIRNTRDTLDSLGVSEDSTWGKEIVLREMGVLDTQESLKL